VDPPGAQAELFHRSYRDLVAWTRNAKIMLRLHQEALPTLEHKQFFTRWHISHVNLLSEVAEGSLVCHIAKQRKSSARVETEWLIPYPRHQEIVRSNWGGSAWPLLNMKVNAWADM
jgi:hypothetical protein